MRRVSPRVRRMYGILQKKIFLDAGGRVPAVFISGMARSGTTWVGDLINYDSGFRVLFEPFIPQTFGTVSPFNYIQYFPVDAHSRLHEQYAQAVLAGRVRNKWLDGGNDRLFYARRMVKDVRTNLMLGWLRRLVPGMKTILLIRHPLSIAASWIKLNWGTQHGESRLTDLDAILSQESLLADYPLIRSLGSGLDLDDVLTRIIFQYCIMYHVPARQLNSGEVYQLFYENLLTDFDGELGKLISFTGGSPDRALEGSDAKKTSRTNYLRRDFSNGKASVLDQWKTIFTGAQIDSANHLLSEFSLNELYDKDGRPATDTFLK